MLKIVMSVMGLLMLPFIRMSFLWVVTASMMFILSLLMMFMLPMGMNLLLVNFFFFFDSLNVPLISLMLWIMGLMVMSSFKIIIFNDKFRFFIFNLLSLSLILLLYFMVDNLMVFYLMFEGSLIPTMIMIMMWGYQPERLQASMYFMIYTVMASLPLLIGLLMIWDKNFSLSLLMSSWDSPMVGAINSFWWISLMVAFMVKLPLYTFHLWLPKAHVEAPVAGSMILAAILLKLGSYGMMRVSSLFPEYSLKLIPMFSSLSMIGACITSAICIRQPDMKSMIAYSSVGHMGLLVVGILSYTSWGWCGALGMMVAHGFCSSGLFSIANMVYESVGSRSLMLVKGLMMGFPCMSMWWFMLVIANMSAPPSFNLFSEIFLLASILSSSVWYSLMFIISSFLVGSFCLFLFSATQHGSISNFLNPLNYSVGRNYLVMVLHVLPLYFLLLQPYSFFLVL